MADILQLFSVVRRLYQPDVLPFAQLLAPSAIQQMRNRYGFAQVLAPTQTQVFAMNGEFRPEGSKSPVPIQQLSVEPNVIQFQVAAETKDGEDFYRDLIKFLSEVSGGENRSFREYGESVQTVAIVTLDFPVEALLSKSLSNFVHQKALPAFKLEKAEAHLQLTHLQWTVSYTKVETEFEYQAKLFTIEPRTGTKPEDRVYFTQSPTSSDIHKKLLQDIERALQGT